MRVTVHSAQGVTADTTHAVLGENTSRAPLYVAMTRGRDTNTAYLYERIASEGGREHAQEPGLHVLRRGTRRDGAQLVCGIIANHDDRAHTAHDIAVNTDREHLPQPGRQPARPPHPGRTVPASGLPALARRDPAAGR